MSNFSRLVILKETASAPFIGFTFMKMIRPGDFMMLIVKKSK